MICEPKGVLDHSLIMKITTAKFPDQRYANILPQDRDYDKRRLPDIEPELLRR